MGSLCGLTRIRADAGTGKAGPVAGTSMTAEGNARKVLERDRLRFEKDKQKLEDLLKTFNVFRKCLAIMLDDNLLKLTVISETLIRKVTNHLVHQQNNPFTKYTEFGLKSFRGVFEKYKGKVGKLDKNSMAELDPDTEILKLLNVLYQDETYIDEEKKSVETNIDNHFQTVSENEEAKGDHLVLLEWFETFVQEET